MTAAFRPVLTWPEHGAQQRAELLVSAAVDPPRHTVVVDAELTARRAHGLAGSGTAMLWRGDHRGARQLLDALRRRIARDEPAPTGDLAVDYRAHRAHRADRARLLGRLLVEVTPDGAIVARRAPDVRDAVLAVHAPLPGRALIAVSELQGLVGAHEWRRRGVDVPALGARIHPHHGVFAPTRPDYPQLVASAPLGDVRAAVDVGTGTGVLAAILARRGVDRVIATDVAPAAVACATENIVRLGLADQVEVARADLFGDGDLRVDLVVTNPPWVPGTPSSSLDAGVFDPDGSMLDRLVRALPDRLTPDGEAWLLLSDLPELVGLRPSGTVARLAEEVGLVVVDRTAAPRRPAAGRRAWQAAETVELWRLRRG